MTHHKKSAIRIWQVIHVLFTIALLVSCGGGGGGGGGSSAAAPAASPVTPSSSVFTTVDTSGEVGWYTSIATGTVHIAYYDAGNGYLKYAYHNGSTWSTVTVDSSVDVGMHASAAVETDDTVHAVYYDYTNGNLKYAVCAGVSDCTQAGNWSTATIDSTGDVGEYASIAVASDGTVHASYYDLTNGNLKYATCAGAADCTQAGNWSPVVVDSAGDVGEHASIAVESDGTVHASYYDFTSSNLKYATCAGATDCTQAGNWGTEVVDSSADAGMHSSVDVEADSTVHISYYDFTNGNLKYAAGTAGAFSSEVVDSTGDVGEYSSIAVEADSTVHISYYDFDNEDLKYASGTSGAFSAAVADSTGEAGEYSSIAVDAGGTVHISYYYYIDASNGYLKYAAM